MSHLFNFTEITSPELVYKPSCKCPDSTCKTKIRNDFKTFPEAQESDKIKTKVFKELMAVVDALEWIVNRVPSCMVPLTIDYTEAGVTIPISGYLDIDRHHASVYRKYLTVDYVSSDWFYTTEDFSSIAMEAGIDTLYTRLQVRDIVEITSGLFTGRFYRVSEIDPDNERFKLAGYSGEMIKAGDSIRVWRYVATPWRRLEAKEKNRCWNYHLDLDGNGQGWENLCLKNRTTEYQGTNSGSCKNISCPDFDSENEGFKRVANCLHDIVNRWMYREKKISVLIETLQSTVIAKAVISQRSGPSIVGLLGDYFMGTATQMGDPGQGEVDTHTFPAQGGFIQELSNSSSGYVSGAYWRFWTDTDSVTHIDNGYFYRLLGAPTGFIDDNDPNVYITGSGSTGDIIGELRNWLPSEGEKSFNMITGD